MNEIAAYVFIIIAILQLIFAFIVTTKNWLSSLCFKILPVCNAIALALMVFEYTDWITINFL